MADQDEVRQQIARDLNTLKFLVEQIHEKQGKTVDGLQRVRGQLLGIGFWIFLVAALLAYDIFK